MAKKKTVAKPTGAKSVEDYLAQLPEDRREALSAIRKVILKRLPKGIEEGIQYGMIGYFVPHSIYPDGYHAKPEEPLPFASIASQKNHMALYGFNIYIDEKEKERFVKGWKATGKKLDMGKSCVRFKKLEDVPLNVIEDSLKRSTVEKFIKTYEKAMKR